MGCLTHKEMYHREKTQDTDTTGLVYSFHQVTWMRTSKSRSTFKSGSLGHSSRITHHLENRNKRVTSANENQNKTIRTKIKPATTDINRREEQKCAHDTHRHIFRHNTHLVQQNAHFMQCENSLVCWSSLFSCSCKRDNWVCQQF